MKTIYLRGRGHGADVVQKHLEARGHIVRGCADDTDVTVCWGVSWPLKGTSLNRHVNEFDKFECFDAFRKEGVRCPTTFEVRQIDDAYNFANDPLPWLARKRHHVKGKDIRVCQTNGEVRRVIQGKTHDFFSVWIPTQTEYRVWVFHNRILAVYEKVYKGKGEYKGFMRNHRFGFAFEKRDDIRGDAKIAPLSIAAVKSLHLDFGAVDVLRGKDGKLYALEVNSMPQIEGTERSSGIRLAHAISRWAEKQ